ncbi:FecR domain-containing protein [Brevundimonas staleyi]|uniref:FecR family protein n=1 Tax=Brevundimonas staleyi TaxID=74326 RepID=A0ABW0FV38_9CAUL
MSQTAQTPRAARDAAATWCVRMADPDLTPAERDAFRAWLDTDPVNPGLFQTAIEAWAITADQADDPDMIVLRAAAIGTLRRVNRRRAWSGWAAAAAAMVVLAAGAGLWQARLPMIYETGIGERRLVALADGSKLSLDADSEVRVRFDHGRRRLALERGRARFSVAKDPLRPFSVMAGDKTVVATGTAFSVERLGPEVRVILYEGGVTVLTGTDRGERTPVRVADTAKTVEQALRPGGALILQAAQAEAVLTAADTGPSLAWEGGQLVFVDEPLAAAVARINRYADRPLGIGDAAAGRVRISGVFNAGSTTAFVEGVTATFPIEARQRDGTTILVHATARGE